MEPQEFADQFLPEGARMPFIANLHPEFSLEQTPWATLASAFDWVNAPEGYGYWLDHWKFIVRQNHVPFELFISHYFIPPVAERIVPYVLSTTHENRQYRQQALSIGLFGHGHISKYAVPWGVMTWFDWACTSEGRAYWSDIYYKSQWHRGQPFTTVTL